MAATDLSARERRLTLAVDRLVLAISRHWLAGMNLALAFYIGLSLAAPVLRAAGADPAADLLYFAYSLVCHTIPDRHYLILGYRSALDHRSLAIYTAMLAFGLVVFPLVRHRLSPLPVRAYVLLILPMALDGFTQLFGFRTSNWWLRTITGGLFGAATVWLAFPLLEAGMRDVRRQVEETLRDAAAARG